MAGATRGKKRGTKRPSSRREKVWVKRRKPIFVVVVGLRIYCENGLEQLGASAPPYRSSLDRRWGGRASVAKGGRTVPTRATDRNERKKRGWWWWWWGREDEEREREQQRRRGRLGRPRKDSRSSVAVAAWRVALTFSLSQGELPRWLSCCPGFLLPPLLRLLSFGHSSSASARALIYTRWSTIDFSRLSILSTSRTTFVEVVRARTHTHTHTHAQAHTLTHATVDHSLASSQCVAVALLWTSHYWD